MTPEIKHYLMQGMPNTTVKLYTYNDVIFIAVFDSCGEFLSALSCSKLLSKEDFYRDTMQNEK